MYQDEELFVAQLINIELAHFITSENIVAYC